LSKHLASQRYVFKIHSSRLRRAKWDLQLSIKQARENKELIALSESQMMRFIDELNGITNPELHISDIKSKIKNLKYEKNLSDYNPDSCWRVGSLEPACQCCLEYPQS